MNLLRKILVCGLILVHIKGLGQIGKEIDLGINNNKGTIVIREIVKDNLIPKDSCELVIRILQPFCNQLKKTHMPYELLKFDGNGYSIGDDGYIRLRLIRGDHVLSIDYQKQYSTQKEFSPLADRVFRLRPKRKYTIDIQLPVPYSQDYH